MTELLNSPPVGSRALMQQLNAVRVIHELRQRGPLSCAALSRAIGLSKPTVYALVDLLEQLQYITSTSKHRAQEGPGRPSRLYAFRPDFGYVLGADIGADKIIVMISDLDGTVLSKVRFDHGSSASSKHLDALGTFRRACGQALEQAGIDAKRLMSVVVGIPGVLAADGTLSNIPQIPEWEGFAIKRELESQFSCPVTVEREVNLLVRAEKQLGLARDLSNALLIQLGVGVGAGLLMDGKVFQGANGAAGEIGSMPIGTPDGEQDAFGQFEWASGGAGIAARGSRAAKEPGGEALLAAANGDPGSIDAALVFATARDGDKASARIVNSAVDTLATGIAVLICAFNPEAVILSGGMTMSQDLILGPLTTSLKDSLPFTPHIAVSELTDSAVPLGAIHYGLDVAAVRLTHIPELTHFSDNDGAEKDATN